MNLADKELCNELYELSGWVEPQYAVQIGYKQKWEAYYSLGYLLRKLPKELDRKGPGTTPGLEMKLDKNQWIFEYADYYYEPWQNYYTQSADNPEDAACKLVIELIKQGVLHREQ